MKKKLILIVSVIVIAVLALTGAKAAQGKFLLGSSAESSKESQAADDSQAKTDDQKKDDQKRDDQKKDNGAKDDKKTEEKKKEAPKAEEKSSSTASAKPQGSSSSSTSTPASNPQQDASGSSAPESPKRVVQAVSISIVDTVSGKNFPSGTVEIGSSATVRDASMKFFSDKGIDARLRGGNYIYYIDGLKELDVNVGPSSGWCVYVNTKKIPVGIAEFSVKPGDSIVWKYMEDGVSK